MSAVHEHEAAAAAVGLSERARLGRRAQLFAAASLSYNAIEGVIALAAGLVAGSVALVGFGLDSAIEVSSALIILWQFRQRLPQNREQRAVRLIALSFFALAAFVTVDSLRTLALRAEPEASPVGIGLALASLTLMPLLARAQRRTGKELHSTSVIADSNQTLLCTYMSAALLVGLTLNATAGWWWADPVAGLVIAGIAFREGREAWRGEGCCATTVVAARPGAEAAAASSGSSGRAADCC